jgi:peptide deformylase
MAILKVARMGHPVLRKRAQPLDPREIATPRIQRLIDDMFETLHDSRGIGLAGPQVHESIRLFVAGVDDPDGGMSPVVVINPEVTPIGSAVEEDWEGCLSIPDIRGRVPRPAKIRLRALDRHGRPLALTADGYPARVIQHETDHLDGVLFFDRMTSFETITFLEEYGRYWTSKSDD